MKEYYVVSQGGRIQEEDDHEETRNQPRLDPLRVFYCEIKVENDVNLSFFDK